MWHNPLFALYFVAGESLFLTENLAPLGATRVRWDVILQPVVEARHAGDSEIGVPVFIGSNSVIESAYC